MFYRCILKSLIAEFFLLPFTFITVCSFTAFANENITLRNFYPTTLHTDSLENVANSYKKNTVQYLHALLRLEMCRSFNFTKSDKNIEEIRRLSQQLNVPIGTAFYHYAKAETFQLANHLESFQHLQKALRYFENNKDTTGTILCLIKLYTLNISELQSKRGDLKQAKILLDKLNEWGRNSSFIFEKVKVSLILSTDWDLFFPPILYKEKIKRFDAIFREITKVPVTERAYLLFQFYEAKAAYMNEQGKQKNALLLHQKSLQNCKFCSPKLLIMPYNNLGFTYYLLGNYAKSEEYYMKNILISKQFPDELEEIYIEAYDSYASLQSFKNNYKEAWEYKTIKDSLQEIYNEHIKTNDFLNLQTKYETEKKEQRNVLLAKEKKQLSLFLAIGFLLVITLFFFLLKLRTANLKSKALIQLRDQFYTILAHDFRVSINSLSDIKILSSYLIREHRFDDLITLADQMESMAIQSKRLLDNMLQWGKSTEYAMVNKPINFDVSNLLQIIYNQSKPFAKAKNVSLQLKIPPIEIYVTADPKSLEVIVRNMVDNAIKFSSASNHVIISLEQLPSTKKTQIRVTDNSLGISSEQLTYIQKAFAGTIKPELGEQNIGLGILLMVKLARQNKARIYVESQQGEGTIFSIHL